jgi:hypothetical protein
MELKPQILSLNVCKEILFGFEVDPIFNCAPLQDLVFEPDLRGSCVKMMTPRSTKLPCLKALHLCRVRVMNDDFVYKLFLAQNKLFKVEHFSSEPFNQLSTVLIK